jgi:hypothetical protein
MVINIIFSSSSSSSVTCSQVVPHEVVGMANYTKNMLIGTGGKANIDLTHFIGAVSALLLHARCRLSRDRECAGSRHGTHDGPHGHACPAHLESRLADLRWQPAVRVCAYGRRPGGAGHRDARPFHRRLSRRFRARCSPGTRGGRDDNIMDGFILNLPLDDVHVDVIIAQVNMTLLDQELDKVVVYLDPSEFQSTWLGNKAIYRTRMAIKVPAPPHVFYSHAEMFGKDNGTLIIMGPNVRKFGEDEEVDQLIRKYSSRQRVQLRLLKIVFQVRIQDDT